MSIRIRGWKFWTHVSAESTCDRYKGYISAGSEENYNLVMQGIKAYGIDKAMPVFYEPMTKQPFIPITLMGYEFFLRVNFIDDDKYYCVVDKQDTLKKLREFKQNEKIEIDTDAVYNTLCSMIFDAKGWSTRATYHQIESGQSGYLTLPTLQDNFTHGLDEEKFSHYVHHEAEKTKFNLWGNNCADAVLNALQACAPEFIQTSASMQHLVKNTTMPLLGIRNPNLSWLGTSIIDYTRAMREAILQKTISDDTLQTRDKIMQVLRIESMRLADGERNMSTTSLFKLFNLYSLNQKQSKRKALDNAIARISAGTDAVVILDGLLHDDSPIAKGVLSRRTFLHLKDLRASLPEQEEAKVLSLRSQY